MDTMISRAFNACIVGIARYRTVVIILSAFILQVVVMYLISVIIFPDHPGGFKFDTVLQHFFAVAIFAPVFETWLFQECIVKFSMKYLGGSWIISVMLSSLAFCLTHTYSLAYVIVTFCVGILYGMLYLAFNEKKVNAYVHVAIIHSMYNTFGFVMNRFILNS